MKFLGLFEKQKSIAFDGHKEYTFNRDLFEEAIKLQWRACFFNQ